MLCTDVYVWSLFQLQANINTVQYAKSTESFPHFTLDVSGNPENLHSKTNNGNIFLLIERSDHGYTVWSIRDIELMRLLILLRWNVLLRFWLWTGRKMARSGSQAAALHYGTSAGQNRREDQEPPDLLPVDTTDTNITTRHHSTDWQVAWIAFRYCVMK